MLGQSTNAALNVNDSDNLTVLTSSMRWGNDVGKLSQTMCSAFAENAGNGVSEHLDFIIFRGGGKAAGLPSGPQTVHHLVIFLNTDFIPYPTF